MTRASGVPSSLKVPDAHGRADIDEAGDVVLAAEQDVEVGEVVLERVIADDHRAEQELGADLKAPLHVGVGDAQRRLQLGAGAARPEADRRLRRESGIPG